MRGSIIFFIGSVIMSYLSFSYSTGDFNAMNWDSIVRIMHIFVIGLSNLIYHLIKHGEL